MLSVNSLYIIARCRYEEAKILLEADKPDGAAYLCGYAMELILKRHIVKLLNWDGYPETRSEFEHLQSFKVHKLDVLLNLSGLKKVIEADSTALARWQKVSRWDSEIRYRNIGTLSKAEAQDIINATRDTVNRILHL